MASSWDENGRRVVDDNGAYIYVPYLLSTDQVDRWVAAGVDLAGCARRSQTVLKSFRAASDVKSAYRILHDHFAHEGQIILSQGVATDDPDFHRIARSARAYEFDPA